MKLQKTVYIQEGHGEEPSSHYEAPRDMEELVPRPQQNSLCTPMRTCYTCVILVLAVVVPVVTFFAVFSNNPEFQPEPWTCNVKADHRVPCATEKTETACLQASCCWNGIDLACFHSIPSQYSYSVKDWKNNKWAVNELETANLSLTSRMETSPYGRPVERLLQTFVVATSADHLRLYIYSETDKPEDTEGIPLNSSRFRAEVYGPEYYSLQIYRQEDSSSLLFSTSRGPVIASENYWELSLQFPKEAALFGLGGVRLSSKPKLLYSSGHRLSANPFIIVVEADGSAYGILFNSTGPLEFQLLENSNLLIVKSLSTVRWDFSVFAGPTPADVMHQYTSADGLHPVLPPSWVLGLHICRDTAKDNETLAAEDALYFIKEAMATGLPYESDCLQEGLLYQMSFTIPESMEHVIEEIQRMQRRILLSLPPHVNSSLVTIDELFVLTEDQQVLSQEYHSLNVSYPDFFNEVTGTWFRENLNNLMTGREDVVGGFVLQDNWPAVNTTEDKTENMVYVPEGTLSRGTLWWEVRHGSTPHYKLHNKYSLQNAKSVASSLQLEKHLVLSAATYTGSGTVGGSHAHTQADVACTWSNMKDALEMALGQGLAGIPLAGGGSVCGTTGSYDDELCIRWYLMSSMLPLMRVSSEMPLRDPVNLKFGYAREAVKRALALRYSLLAYFYSLFHNASSKGVPIARPMFFDFPSDNKTWTENEQFMVGPALLVRPAFYKNAVSVPVYLPNENTTWYHFGGGHKVNNGTGEVTVGVTSLDKELVLLLRGGFIVPVQKAKPTVNETLSGPYNLVVGLKCNENGTCSAFGDLTVDSNIKFTFSATERELSFQSVCVNTTSSPTLENISVYGLNMTACLNVSSSFNTGASCAVAEGNQILEITDLQLDLCSKGDGQIHWEVTDIPQSTTTIKPETSTINPETTTKIETTEPETTEPKTTEPKTTEPETTEPKTTEPETTEPETTEPETTEPKTTEPETTEPKTTEPKTTEPETTEPKTTEPKTTEPETTEPKTTEPETTEPKTTEPETTEPKTTEPETTEPETTEPKTTEPKTTEPETTEPKTTEPETTEPKTTEPETTEPETTEPGTTEPETTEPKTTEPETTEPETTEPGTA